jgi:hypothetical protein
MSDMDASLADSAYDQEGLFGRRPAGAGGGGGGKKLCLAAVVGLTVWTGVILALVGMMFGGTVKDADVPTLMQGPMQHASAQEAGDFLRLNDTKAPNQNAALAEILQPTLRKYSTTADANSRYVLSEGGPFATVSNLGGLRKDWNDGKQNLQDSIDAKGAKSAVDQNTAAIGDLRTAKLDMTQAITVDGVAKAAELTEYALKVDLSVYVLQTDFNTVTSGLQTTVTGLQTTVGTLAVAADVHSTYATQATVSTKANSDDLKTKAGKTEFNALQASFDALQTTAAHEDTVDGLQSSLAAVQSQVNSLICATASDTCGHGGCTPKTSITGGTTYTCACHTGWAHNGLPNGDNVFACGLCDSPTYMQDTDTDGKKTCVIDPCVADGQPETCGGHGNCKSHEAGECECQPGYSGTKCGDCSEGYKPSSGGCELDLCYDTDKGAMKDCGQGSCAVDTGACQCNDGYAAPDCKACDSTHYLTTSDSPTCALDACKGTGAGKDCVQAHATCHQDTGECTCNPGSHFAGANCDTCASGFMLGPVTDGSNTCIADPCAGVNCGHGTCSAGNCQCEDHWAQGTGQSGDAYCSKCASGFKKNGDHCDVDPCATVHCGANGHCGADGKCVCEEEYAGPNCGHCKTIDVTPPTPGHWYVRGPNNADGTPGSCVPDPCWNNYDLLQQHDCIGPNGAADEDGPNGVCAPDPANPAIATCDCHDGYEQGHISCDACDTKHGFIDVANNKVCARDPCWVRRLLAARSEENRMSFIGRSEKRASL